MQLLMGARHSTECLTLTTGSLGDGRREEVKGRISTFVRVKNLYFSIEYIYLLQVGILPLLAVYAFSPDLNIMVIECLLQASSCVCIYVCWNGKSRLWLHKKTHSCRHPRILLFNLRTTIGEDEMTL